MVQPLPDHMPDLFRANGSLSTFAWSTVCKLCRELRVWLSLFGQRKNRLERQRSYLLSVYSIYIHSTWLFLSRSWLSVPSSNLLRWEKIVASPWHQHGNQGCQSAKLYWQVSQSWTPTALELTRMLAVRRDEGRGSWFNNIITLAFLTCLDSIVKQLNPPRVIIF